MRTGGYCREALTDVEDGHSQLDVSKMAGADLDVLLARRALVHAVDGTQPRVVEALDARQVLLLVHGLRVDDVHNAHRLDLLGREQAELDLLDGAQWALGHGGGATGSHGCGRWAVGRGARKIYAVLPVVAVATPKQAPLHGGAARYAVVSMLAIAMVSRMRWARALRWRRRIGPADKGCSGRGGCGGRAGA